MIKAAIICGLISLVTGAQSTCTENEFKELGASLSQSVEYMRDKVGDENVAIFIGAKGAGKSTLINYLIGNQLKTERRSLFDPVTLARVYSESKGPRVAGESTKAAVPTRWTSSKLPNLTLWDYPGFGDDNAVLQEVTSVFDFHQLAKYVKSLKVILVIDFNDLLQANIEPLVKLLTINVEKYFGNHVEEFLSGLSVIFTKVPAEVRKSSFDMNYLNTMLTNKFLLNKHEEVPQIVKKFVQYLVDNNQQIGLFKKIVHGLITSDADFNIIPAIENSKSIESSALKKLRHSISEASKLCLQKFKLSEAIADSKLFLTGIFGTKIFEIETALKQKYNKDNELKTLKTKLVDMGIIVSNAKNGENDLYKKIEIYKVIDDSIKYEVENFRLIEVSKLIEFVNNVLNKAMNKPLESTMKEVLIASDASIQKAIADINQKLEIKV
ncbi:uncharacterized protein LOC122506731 [Leptopilina heterotoma]|uniref:uncharacterized protein LOC122506731 n=1 Tax=Leptopilina heterotoma TaxID=63436 RepID=UPI001CA9C58F|nr:uncharacterized protein LOC122506731 [Leptopilina heterotoma]